MAGCASKTSPREAKAEAGELGRAAGRAVPHCGAWDIPEGGQGGLCSFWGPTLVAKLGDLLDDILTATLSHLKHGARATQFEGLPGTLGNNKKHSWQAAGPGKAVWHAWLGRQGHSSSPRGSTEAQALGTGWENDPSPLAAPCRAGKGRSPQCL